MIVVPKRKGVEIITSIQVCFISWMNNNYKKMVEKKAFLSNAKVNIMYPNLENMTVVPITKRMEIIMNIQVCLISRMNNNYKGNGGKEKLYLQIQSIIIVYPNKVNMIIMPNHKNSGDYYKYLSLSHFAD